MPQKAKAKSTTATITDSFWRVKPVPRIFMLWALFQAAFASSSDTLIAREHASSESPPHGKRSVEPGLVRKKSAPDREASVEGGGSGRTKSSHAGATDRRKKKSRSALGEAEKAQSSSISTESGSYSSCVSSKSMSELSNVVLSLIHISEPTRPY